MERVADTVTPQPVLAVARFSTSPLERPARPPRWLVVCVDVRDPGNARHRAAQRRGGGSRRGNLLRRFGRRLQPEDGAGVGRFAVPCPGGGRRGARGGARAAGRGGTAAAGHGRRAAATPYDERRSHGRRSAFVLGNEATACPTAVDARCRRAGHHPDGRAARESLNVGMAAAVLCFEAARQRPRSR